MDPRKVRIRQKIRKLRKIITNNWKVQSCYDKNRKLFYITISREAQTSYDFKAIKEDSLSSVHQKFKHIFSEDRYRDAVRMSLVTRNFYYVDKSSYV